jgi:hypothetical protein
MHVDDNGRIFLDPAGEEVELGTGGTATAKKCRGCGHIFRVTDGLDNGYCLVCRRKMAHPAPSS